MDLSVIYTNYISNPNLKSTWLAWLLIHPGCSKKIPLFRKASKEKEEERAARLDDDRLPSLPIFPMPLAHANEEGRDRHSMALQVYHAYCNSFHFFTSNSNAPI